MNGKLCKAFILASALATAGCEKHPAQSAFEPDPIVHPASGRIVFNRICAGENPAASRHTPGWRQKTTGGAG
jgi:hypothetical protein